MFSQTEIWRLNYTLRLCCINRNFTIKSLSLYNTNFILLVRCFYIPVSSLYNIPKYFSKLIRFRLGNDTEKPYQRWNTYFSSRSHFWCNSFHIALEYIVFAGFLYNNFFKSLFNKIWNFSKKKNCCLWRFNDVHTIVYW